MATWLDNWEYLDRMYASSIGEDAKAFMLERRMPEEVQQYFLNGKDKFKKGLSDRIEYLRETANRHHQRQLGDSMMSNKQRQTMNAVQLKEAIVNSMGAEAGERFDLHVLNAVSVRRSKGDGRGRDRFHKESRDRGNFGRDTSGGEAERLEAIDLQKAQNVEVKAAVKEEKETGVIFAETRIIEDQSAKSTPNGGRRMIIIETNH